MLVQTEWMKAMIAWTKKPANRAPLVGWLELGKPVNAKEVNDILTCLRSLNPCKANPEHLSDGLRIMEYLTSQQLPVQMPFACKAAAPDFDRFLVEEHSAQYFVCKWALTVFPITVTLV